MFVKLRKVSAMVSRSSLLMAELRRLNIFLKCQGASLHTLQLPRTLNIYADRMSRRRRQTVSFLTLAGITDS